MGTRRGCRVRTLVVLLGVVGGAVSACSRHEPVGAVGANDEISVFTNTPRQGAVAQELERLFSYPVEVVGPERAFRLDFVPFSRFHTHQYVKNQIFAVNLASDDALARTVPKMLGTHGTERLAAQRPFLLLLRDIWATGQSSLFAVAWSEAELYDLLIRADSTEVRRDYESSVITGLAKTMFSLGEDRSIPSQLARQYGWTLRLPRGFHAAEDPQGRVVKMNTKDPVRLLLVHWMPELVPLSREEWASRLARVLEVYNDGDFVLEERTQVFAATFQDEPALKWEGVWQNEKYVIGGPFRALAFHRGADSFLLVGIVFAPGQDKVYALRQVEAILSTFRRVS